MHLQGSGYSSEPAREGDAKPETLPHMFNKDWELNLDALEVESSDNNLFESLETAPLFLILWYLVPCMSPCDISQVNAKFLLHMDAISYLCCDNHCV